MANIREERQTTGSGTLRIQWTNLRTMHNATLWYSQRFIRFYVMHQGSNTKWSFGAAYGHSYFFRVTSYKYPQEFTRYFSSFPIDADKQTLTCYRDASLEPAHFHEEPQMVIILWKRFVQRQRKRRLLATLLDPYLLPPVLKTFIPV